MLDIENLHVRRGRAEVIRGVTLPRVAGGSVVGVIGQNGAGKSSLLQAVAGLLPAVGSVRLDGAELAPASRARHVAYMPDIPLAAAELTVVEAVRAGLARSRQGDLGLRAVARILDTFEIRHLGLAQLATLSAGERQLVSLAQVCARQASVVLLDEPTSCLDLRNQLVALERVRSDTRSRGCVTLMAMHDIGLAARFADRIAALANGVLAAFGTPEETLTPALLESVYGIEGALVRGPDGDILVCVRRALPAAAARQASLAVP